MKYRILVVEDIPSTRATYRRILDPALFEVYEAGNLEEALPALDAISFHVIVVDLGLDERDPSNFQGQSVLERAAELNEGARLLVVSQKRGGRAHDITVKAYERLGLSKWLFKGQTTPQEIIETVTTEARRATLPIFEKCTNVLEAVLHGQARLGWEHEALRALKVRGGIAVLSSAIESLVGPLAPLRPHVDMSKRASIEDGQVIFTFWSKVIGSGMVAILASWPLEAAPRELERRVALGKLHGIVFRDGDRMRSEYL